MATITDFKKYDAVRNILIPDISVDSDLRIKVEHYHAAVDSDSAIRRNYDSDINALYGRYDALLARVIALETP